MVFALTKSLLEALRPRNVFSTQTADYYHYSAAAFYVFFYFFSPAIRQSEDEVFI